MFLVQPDPQPVRRSHVKDLLPGVYKAKIFEDSILFDLFVVTRQGADTQLIRLTTRLGHTHPPDVWNWVATPSTLDLFDMQRVDEIQVVSATSVASSTS